MKTYRVVPVYDGKPKITWSVVATREDGQEHWIAEFPTEDEARLEADRLSSMASVRLN